MYVSYMISASTLWMMTSIRDMVSPYLAARAVFLLWQGRFRDGPRLYQPVSIPISTNAFPELGGGEPEACARQVRGAIEDVLLGDFAYPSLWGQVLQRHEEQRHEEFLGVVLHEVY